MTTTTNLARLPIGASLFLLSCITGCATDNSARLRLTCVESDDAYTQRFADAYVSKGADGDTEVVLVSDPEASAETGADLRQVMHVKVLWRPQKGTKQSHPSYTNASLHWYVFDENTTRTSSPDVLEYSGAGFVTLADAIGGTAVTIRNATLKPAVTSNGSLSDPVGPARLAGTFLARKSAKRVNALLAEVKHATDGVRAEQASAR